MRLSGHCGHSSTLTRLQRSLSRSRARSGKASLDSLFRSWKSLFERRNSLFECVGDWLPTVCIRSGISARLVSTTAEIGEVPCILPANQGTAIETSSPPTPSTATQAGGMRTLGRSSRPRRKSPRFRGVLADRAFGFRTRDCPARRDSRRFPRLSLWAISAVRFGLEIAGRVFGIQVRVQNPRILAKPNRKFGSLQVRH